MKKCSKCKIEKPYSEFGKYKKNKDGYQYDCKSCIKERSKKYYQNNKERFKEYHKKYYQDNKERVKECVIQYRKDNTEYYKEYHKKYYQDNTERIKEYKKKYYQDNKERNRERIKEYNKKHYQNNKEHKKEYQKKWSKQRKQTNPLYKLKCNLRNRTYIAFKNKGYKKNTKTQEMLGVDWGIVKAHIERQFVKGMNWDNYGEWHIDHIIPLASANTKEQLMRLCHYSNLQPLWAEENLSKKDKILKNTQIKFRI